MKRIVTSLFLALAATGAFAQEEFHFSLSQAIEYALKNQKDVLNAEMDTRVAEYKVKEIVGMGMPQLSAGFDLKDYEKIPVQSIPDFLSPAVYDILVKENLIPTQPPYDPAVFPLQFGTQWNATASLTASQLLFDPSYLLGVKASRVYNDLSQKAYTRTRIETAVSVIKAYYNILVLKAAKPVMDANLVRVKKLQDDTKALYDNGFVEKIDVDRVTVTHNNIQAEKEKFDRQIELANFLLKYQMGMPVKSTLFLTDSLNINDVKDISTAVENFDVNRRVEYTLLKTQRQFLEYNVKRYKNAGVPKLYLYGTLSTTAQRNEFNIFDSGEKWYPTGLVGATLSFPIFDGFSRRSRVHQSQFELLKVDNDVTNFENAAQVEIEKSRNDLLNAITSLNVQEKNLDLAEEVQKTTKIKYDQGVGSNIEVLIAETSLKEAQANYYTALFNAILAKVDLEKSLGNINY